MVNGSGRRRKGPISDGASGKSRRQRRPPAFDSKNGKAPPSRHLWVGNLSHSIMENDLTEHFLQFGELESVAFQPGRSYAFLNFKREDEAIAAMESLQGFPVAGNPLRIEFTKADKSSAPSRDEDYSQRRDEQRSALRGSPFLQRESRACQASPEQFYQEKSNMNDKNAEPSAVLWIGFPALLKVDELILKKAFSPFGEIEKITAFPGRSYAFVRFRSVMSACRAKDALQGKLFGNPRVHICFAKSETGSSNSGRNLMNVPPSPHFKGNDRSGSPENFREESKFGSLTGNPSIRSPQYFPDLDAGDSDPYSLNKKGNLWTGENNTFDQRRFGEMGSELGLSEDIDFLRQVNRMKNHGTCRRYSFPSWGQEIEDRVNSGSQLANPVDRRRFTPEPDQSSFNVWKWEGTIAKGGTPVCRARCFPVGKVLDMILPEFLDCTARTGLDMLSKHYYQAASAWVVFFVPESDADIGYYNEFMHYLGEKQRAAVAKLEHPSSNFGSHHQQHERKDRRLLSFPGDTSYTNPSTPSESIHPFTSLPDSSKPGGSNLSFLGNLITSAPPASYSGSAHGVGNGSESYNENRHDYPLHKGSPTLGPNWSSHHLQNSVSGSRNRPTQMSSIAVDPIHQDHRIMQRAVQESSTAGGISHIRNSNSSLHETQSSPSLTALQPDQLAQLASSLLGQQRQPGSTPNPYTREDFRQRNTMNESDNLPRTSQRFGLQNNQVSSEPSTSQFGQVQELQQLQQQVSTVSAVPHMGQRELQAGVQGNQQLQSISSNEAVETDPQKQRMQATLQLAAALLQQIQGGKGS
ncbi:RNA recognition motif-containing protein [Prunus dulcis]|uniref:RNA recognition motif-containing protein n=1 Tax=Prunus dulcis TaxID=3755 RepID=A0A4Y1R6N7_PRUDU|nr:RNA recognition motif-containing protein [Prunus dulcis]